MNDALKLRYGEERLPRYTSYPTAPHFSQEVGADTYRGWLRAVEPDGSASLYLHVPFCRSMCWYCGCHTTITRHDERIADYVATLGREIDLVARELPAGLSVGHVHFGGGTPTIMAPRDFEALMATIRRRFSLDGATEIAVEIDPRALSGDMMRALGDAGVTRASLGVQSFDPAVQDAINRRQSIEETARVVDGLRRAGVRGVNLDLIYGLPMQTVRSCIETAEACLRMGPDRLSVFGYAHVPAFKKHQRVIAEDTLPDAAERLAQADAITNVLVGAGYRRIGLDHFARPDDEMARAADEGRLQRNFQGYTTDASDILLGFGASAIGRTGAGYIQNEIALGRYAELVASERLPIAKGRPLSADDLVRGEIIERIMCDFSVDLEAVCRKHDTSADAILATSPRLAALESDRIVRLDGRRLTVEEDMRALVRSVASAFDVYLPRSYGLHSRAV
jgi:oxygen-independent coproporphyrinogen-3 oxidase